MGLYPSQTALVIRCCVHEREQTADLFSDASDEEQRRETTNKKEDDDLPWRARVVERNVLPRSISTRTTLPIVQ